MNNLITRQFTHFPQPKYFLVVLMMTLGFGFCESVSVRAQQPPVTDYIIADSVKIKLANDPVVKGGALLVDVQHGVVKLDGLVDTSKQKSRAEKIAHKVKGVKQVVNDIVVRAR